MQKTGASFTHENEVLKGLSAGGIPESTKMHRGPGVSFPQGDEALRRSSTCRVPGSTAMHRGPIQKIDFSFPPRRNDFAPLTTSEAHSITLIRSNRNLVPVWQMGGAGAAKTQCLCNTCNASLLHKHQKIVTLQHENGASTAIAMPVQCSACAAEALCLCNKCSCTAQA